MVVCWALAGILAAINLGAYLLIRADKRAAQRQHRSNPPSRVPERTFHLVAAIGGWPGQTLAMRTYRHKTRKRSFQAVMVLASIVGTLGWAGWLVLFGCLSPLGVGL